MTAQPRTLVIACGALARELVAVIEANRLGGLEVTCLPAILHNRPQEIPAAVRRKIRANRDRFDTILCLYGDCGTGGKKASSASMAPIATSSTWARRTSRRWSTMNPARSS